MEQTTLEWVGWQDQQVEPFTVRLEHDGRRWWAAAVPHGGGMEIPDRGAGDSPADALRGLADILDEANRQARRG